MSDEPEWIELYVTSLITMTTSMCFFIEEQSTQMAFWTKKRQRYDFEDVKAFMLEVDIGDMNLI